MTRMPVRVESLPKSRYLPYRRRASSLLSTMERAVVDGQVHGASLAAVHATIAAADALTVFYLGLRSRGQDHRELMALVRRLPLERASESAGRLGSVLTRKSEVEYGSVEPSHREVDALAANCRKFVEWAFRSLPSE